MVRAARRRRRPSDRARSCGARSARRRGPCRRAPSPPARRRAAPARPATRARAARGSASAPPSRCAVDDDAVDVRGVGQYRRQTRAQPSSAALARPSYSDGITSRSEAQYSERMSLTAPRKRTCGARCGLLASLRTSALMPRSRSRPANSTTASRARRPPHERPHRPQQAQLVLLQADAARQQQRARPGRQLPARARLASLVGRRRTEEVDVEQVVDDADLVRLHQRPAHQLVFHADRVGEDDARERDSTTPSPSNAAPSSGCGSR